MSMKNQMRLISIWLLLFLALSSRAHAAMERDTVYYHDGSSVPDPFLCGKEKSVDIQCYTKDTLLVQDARQPGKTSVQDTVMPESAQADGYLSTPWFIKSNLVYDAVLMPSLEVEYRFNDRWSAALEGNMAWWHNNGKHKYYQLATLIPEVRYWFRPQGDRRGHYVGLFGGGGWYDLENGGTGYKGEGGMAGVSYGYMFPVGKYFAFEAGIGVGFMTTRYEEYLPIDGHYVYQQTSRLDYFGPLKLKLSLVWRLWDKKGGAR